MRVLDRCARTSASGGGLTRRLAGLALAVSMVCAAPGAWAAAQHSRSPGPDVSKARAALESEIARIAINSGGEVGVAARHLESGLTLSLNSETRFPMASTFKVAVAGAILSRVDAGQLALDRMVPVDPALVLESEGIAEIFPFPGVTLSVRNLLEGMITRSDNTATNVLTRLAGGPAAVTAWVRKLGVENLRVDGDTNEIVGRFLQLPYSEAANSKSIDEQIKSLPAEEVERRNSQGDAQFADDPRDTTTPAAMLELLTRIVNGQALSPASTELLLGTMQRTITGLKRLRGMLPPGVVVHDKTGTIGGTVNDVGVIELPDHRGRVVIAVYIKKSSKPIEEREAVIAQVARSVYDYMLVMTTPQ
ncbi:MAG: class A beta-lactamase [Proteobacteria bacterium]|nr:class A beta-lactamase [Pseudomonadota bacterium]